MSEAEEDQPSSEQMESHPIIESADVSLLVSSWILFSIHIGSLLDKSDIQNSFTPLTSH